MGGGGELQYGDVIMNHVVLINRYSVIDWEIMYTIYLSLLNYLITTFRY